MRDSARCRVAFAVAVAATVGLVLADAGAEATAELPGRYRIRTVRIEHASAAVIYRLDSATGEICAFGFVQRSPGEAYGCQAGSGGETPGRFELEAVQGARGTAMSSAYRLDRVSGEICRFRLQVASGATLEVLDCVARPASGVAP